jgi:hypothetical protein
VPTVVWGIGMPADAAIRVVMAYTLPAGAVPALSGAQYAAFFVVMRVITSICCVRAGLRRMLGHAAALRRARPPAEEAAQRTEAAASGG